MIYLSRVYLFKRRLNIEIFPFKLIKFCYHFCFLFVVLLKYVIVLQYKLSGMLMLFMRLAQGVYLNNHEQVVILDLLSRMVSFNTVF